jgi:putative signal transducing protein
LEIAPETFRQQYEELSDEALLSIDRNDLIEVAQQYYDAEVARRGLNSAQATPEEAEPKAELVQVATFLSFEEANLGRALLRSADIPAFLDNELSANWTGAAGELRLMVPASFSEQAEEILESQISDEELLAQAEAADPVDVEPAQDEDSD